MLGLDLENEFDFDRHAEWYAGDAEDDTRWDPIRSEDIEQQFRCAIGDLRMFTEISRRSDVDAELGDATNEIQRSELRLGSGKTAEAGRPRRVITFEDRQFLADAPMINRIMSNHWQHAAEEQQGVALDSFDVGAEWGGRRRQGNGQFLQSRFWAAGYHLPRCAPLSTCSTSPVIFADSVR